MANFQSLVRGAAKSMVRPLIHGGDAKRKAVRRAYDRLPNATKLQYSERQLAQRSKQPVAVPGAAPSVAEARTLRKFDILDRQLAAADQLDSTRGAARLALAGGSLGFLGGIGHGIYNMKTKQPNVEAVMDVQKEASAPAKVKDLLLGGMEVVEPLVAGSVGSLVGAGTGLAAAHLTSPVGLSAGVIRKEELAREYQARINHIRERMALNAFRAQMSGGR